MTLSSRPLPSQELPILFEDGEALVIDKPAGLDVTTPRRGGVSVEAYLGELRLGFQRPPSIVHRLDKDTSGCLLLARNDKAHKRFQAAFEAGDVKKRYLAILAGIPEASEGLIDMPLAKFSSKEGGWTILPSPKGKASRTAWRVLKTIDRRALIEFTPETGRTHQLRVHALHGLGHAIFGDPAYGLASASGMMLHAASLSLPRGNKDAVVAEAPWPARFTFAGFDGTGIGHG